MNTTRGGISNRYRSSRRGRPGPGEVELTGVNCGPETVRLPTDVEQRAQTNS
jgi:hypothetical protein